MANVTLSVEEEDLKRARIHAIEQGTSLNAVIRSFVKEYAAGSERYQRITKSILDRAMRSKASSEGRRWHRDEIYDR